MWKYFHLFIRVSTLPEVLHPRPGPNVSYGVFTFAPSSKIVLRYPGILAGKLDFENPKDSICLFSEPTDSNYCKSAILVLGGEIARRVLKVDEGLQ